METGDPTLRTSHVELHLNIDSTKLWCCCTWWFHMCFGLSSHLKDFWIKSVDCPSHIGFQSGWQLYINIITLLRVIPTMTFLHFVTRKSSGILSIHVLVHVVFEDLPYVLYILAQVHKAFLCCSFSFFLPHPPTPILEFWLFILDSVWLHLSCSPSALSSPWNIHGAVTVLKIIYLWGGFGKIHVR